MFVNSKQMRSTRGSFFLAIGRYLSDEKSKAGISLSSHDRYDIWGFKIEKCLFNISVFLRYLS